MFRFALSCFVLASVAEAQAQLVLRTTPSGTQSNLFVSNISAVTQRVTPVPAQQKAGLGG